MQYHVHNLCWTPQGDKGKVIKVMSDSNEERTEREACTEKFPLVLAIINVCYVWTNI